MATPASFLEEECFNVYWKIKNFSFCCDQITSPIFSFYEKKYCLLLQPLFVNVECRLYCPNSYRYDTDFATEISLLTCDGSPEESISGDRKVNLQVLKDVLFGSRRNAFLPDDTLNVRFRGSTTTKRGKLFICSQIGVKQNYFLWTFKYESDYELSYAKSAEDSTQYGNIVLKLKSAGGINCDEQFSIEISRTGGERCLCVLKISVLNLDGKALNEVKNEFVLEKRDGEQTRGFPSIIKKSQWIEYKNLLLSEDMLTLKCYLVMSPGTITDPNPVIRFCESAAPFVKESDYLTRSFQEKQDSVCAMELQTDLKSILDNGPLQDVSLHIDSEVIRAHKSILSARSPVFRAMFTKDMKEAIDNAVVIEEFDVETVRRLLLYLYTDTIHDGQWESMKKLCFVADKYGVLSLKEKCVSFLKTNLSVSNVCEALAIVDLQQDEDLKKAALDFISEYDSAVFASEEWKELEKTRSSVACQVLREICCNKRFRSN